MSDYTKIPTSAEVVAVIHARHHEMVVFSSYSAPGGDMHSDPSKGVMQTSYGFKGFDYPVTELRTTWDISSQYSHKRENLKTEYWLCLPKKEDEK